MFKRRRKIGQIYKTETDWGAVCAAAIIVIVVLSALGG